MTQTRKHTAACAAALLFSLSVPLVSAQPTPAQPVPAKPAITAPNVIEISPSLTTAGQPTPESLAGLAAQGYEAVIYLAPPTVGDAVREEPLIVGKQGIFWANIPIKFDNPTAKDFETFAAVLSALGKRKVLVHCQVNMRASSLVFLYRVLVGKEDPKLAYEPVSKVWVPDGPWKRLIQEQLKKGGIEFELL